MENKTLYVNKDCFFTKLLQASNKFGNVKLHEYNVNLLSDTEKEKILSRSPTHTFPVLQVGSDLFISGTNTIMKYLMSSEKLLDIMGNNNKTAALISMWVDYCTFNVWSLYPHTIGQVLGQCPENLEVFNSAVEDLMTVLGQLNHHLTFKTYLVETTFSYADLFVAGSLNPFFSLILDESRRNLFPNVTRWYSFIGNLNQLSSVLGKPRMCCQTQQPKYAGEAKKIVLEEKQSVTNESHDKKADKKNKKKEELKKKDEPKKKEEPKVEEKTDEPEPERKSKNPLDNLTPSTFNIDDFKREFLNSKNKNEALEHFWKIHDNNGFSLWFLHYDRTKGQGESMMKASNFKSIFLQNLNDFRKYCFGSFGVYGEEPSLEYEGVFLWRGSEIPAEIKNHDSYDYSEYDKLDVNKPEDKKMVEEFWLKIGENDVVNSRKVRDVEYFR